MATRVLHESGLVALREYRRARDRPGLFYGRGTMVKSCAPSGSVCYLGIFRVSERVLGGEGVPGVH